MQLTKLWGIAMPGTAYVSQCGPGIVDMLCFELVKVSVVKAVGLLVQVKYIVNKICVLFGNGQGRDCSLNCVNLLSECAVVIFLRLKCKICIAPYVFGNGRWKGIIRVPVGSKCHIK
jgi:hypothetical protein